MLHILLNQKSEEVIKINRRLALGQMFLERGIALVGVLCSNRHVKNFAFRWKSRVWGYLEISVASDLLFAFEVTCFRAMTFLAFNLVPKKKSTIKTKQDENQKQKYTKSVPIYVYYCRLSWFWGVQSVTFSNYSYFLSAIIRDAYTSGIVI